jgi:hypothetical protein
MRDERLGKPVDLSSPILSFPLHAGAFRVFNFRKQSFGGPGKLWDISPTSDMGSDNGSPDRLTAGRLVDPGAEAGRAELEGHVPQSSRLLPSAGSISPVV